MSVGFGFLLCVVDEQASPSRIAEHQLSEAMFVNEEQRVLRFMARFFVSHGSLPSREIIERELQLRLPTVPQAPISFWAEKVRERHLHNLLTSGIAEVRSSLSDENLEAAVTRVQSLAISSRNLHFGGIVTNVVAIGEEVLQYHRRVQNASELLGIPSGFPALDDSMGGMQAGDLIVITGRPGLGKSYILLRMALEAYLQGRRVLFITMEMTNRQCVSRLLALKTRVQHSRLRKGLLSAYALNLVRDELDVFRGNDRLQFVEGSLSSKASEVSLRIQEASPEIVFIDGAYLIAPDDSWIKSKWERTAAVAEDLKRACLKFSIPIVASYQQSRRAEQKGGSSLSTIGLSDIIGQLSSAVFDISIEDAEASESFEQMDSNRPDSRVLSSLKLREGGFLNFRVSFDLTRMLIEQVEVISSSEE